MLNLGLRQFVGVCMCEGSKLIKGGPGGLKNEPGHWVLIGGRFSPEYFCVHMYDMK